MSDFVCCGETPVRSNNEYFGRWMCPHCNQLFDRTFDVNGDDSNGEFVATGMFASREEQEVSKTGARALSILLGHQDVFSPDVN